MVLRPERRVSRSPGCDSTSGDEDGMDRFFLSEGKEEDNGPGSGCRQIINERLCGNCIIDNLILVLKW